MIDENVSWHTLMATRALRVRADGHGFGVGVGRNWKVTGVLL